MSWPSNRDDEPGTAAGQRAEWREQFADSDRAAGIEVGDDFEPFNQINDMFTRAFWDDAVKSEHSDGFFASYRMDATSHLRRGEGFNHKDFALRNAAWSVSDIISNRGGEAGLREGFQAPIQNDTPVAEQRLAVDDPQAMSDEIKKIAKLFGANLVGIAAIDRRWHYSKRVDTRAFEAVDNSLPADLTHVIVLGHAMDYELVRTYPSALAGVSTGLEYSREAAIVIQLASYIRNLGYQAVASMNDTALVIPYALKAGLGEYGRNQMLITPEYGPRVRFSKVFTSLPLCADAPRRLGIREYCEICSQCADACPPKALPYGPPAEASNADGGHRSTIKGVKKWSADCEKCFGYWVKLKSDCAICMRVCPFNHNGRWPGKWLARLARSRWRSLALWIENRRGLPRRLKPKEWWAHLSDKT